MCEAWLTGSADTLASWEGLQVSVINVSGRSYKYAEIDSWTAPSFKYTSISDKTIAVFQLILKPASSGYLVFPALVSLRDI